MKEERVNLNNIQLLSKESYEQDLRNLVNFIPDYEQVKREVNDFLKELK